MEQSCKQCGSAFEITPDDLAFYDKVSPVFAGKKEPISPPTLCPECRFQRRVSWRNDRSLYPRTCARCHRKIISLHANDSSYGSILCTQCFWEDACDATTHGREYQEDRPFFEQFRDLQQAVPYLGIINDNGMGSENCEYCQDFAYGKNCYLVTIAWKIQDSMYSSATLTGSKNIVDCFFVYESELAYQCLFCNALYRSAFMRESTNCNNCVLGIDLRGCSDCIACFGLRQKRFHIFNEPYSEEEYRVERDRLLTGGSADFMRLQQQFEDWVLSFPRRHLWMHNCEQCVGDHLFNCKNTMGFETFNAEGCKFFSNGDSPRFCYDIFVSGENELCLEGITPDRSYQALFSLWTWRSRYMLYTDGCYDCEHCFGCVSLKRQKYCILNQQYTKEEYEALVPKIIEKMRADGEWGEFFPVAMSPFAYNETVAQEYFPMSKEEVLNRGWKWRDQTDEMPKVDKIIPAAQLPDSIDDIPDDILNWAIECDATRRPFKIIKQELEFYRQMRLPVPRYHPDERHRRRMALRNPRKLWDRECAKCQQPIATSYSPERPEIVYCESCYLAEVY